MSYLVPTSPQQLHTTATVASGSRQILLCGGQTKNLTIVLQGNGTTSGGTVVVEHAYYSGDTPYTGTWTPLTTLNASDVSGGKQTAVFAQGSFWAIGVRIATDITGGGTVTTFGWGNE